jgi:hypothetical protein
MAFFDAFVRLHEKSRRLDRYAAGFSPHIRRVNQSAQ